MNRQAPKKPDWAEIRARYESSGESLRHMAERFGVPFDTIKKRSSREKWLKVPDSEMAPPPENGTNNGTTTDLAAKNGTAEMAPLPENGTNNGTTINPTGKNGITKMAPPPENGTNPISTHSTALPRRSSTSEPSAGRFIRSTDLIVASPRNAARNRFKKVGVITSHPTSPGMTWPNASARAATTTSAASFVRHSFT
jgi:hypothetical protein